MAENALWEVLTTVRRRLLGVSAARGLGWGVAAGIAVLILCAWLDLALDLPPAVRVACALAAVACGVALVAGGVVTFLKQGGRAALARRLDRAGGGGGQILAGVDLARQYGSGAAVSPGGLSVAMARLAVERAASLAAGVRAAAAVPAGPLAWPLGAAGVVAASVALLALAAPRLAGTQWARFTDPFGDHPPYSPIQFHVQPGATKVLYGSALDVRVTTEGGAVERLDLVLVPANSPVHATAAAETLPMFPEPGGRWRASVADVTAPGRYFVRTRGARSQQFPFDVVTVPELRDVKFRVTPPAYTRRPPYEGPLPPGGLAGLAGTKVELWARSNRPLSGGVVQFAPAEDAAPPATQAAAAPAGAWAVTLAPDSADPAVAAGSFVIRQPGKFEVRVTDAAGQASKDVFAGSVGVLHDDRPFVRVLEPKASSYATPDVTLNVALLAEDDYGLTRVQLFRSLNDSRPRAIDAPVPADHPTRLPVTVPLPLADYGLQPGDVIRLFARVEDNDPAGAKGSESSVVTVQIISREDLNRMTLARDGMEVLQSKYEQARRRLETLDNEIRKQQKELAQLDPASDLAKDARKKLDDLAQDVEDAAAEIAKNAGEDLPFDIDRKFRQSLKDLADDVRQAGEGLKRDAARPGLSAAGAGEVLEKLREALGTKREAFENEATLPLEFLAKIFPLKEAEARFIDVARRQRDLAQRMESMKAQAGDDPKAKARMRDLEAEQHRLRDDLRELLDEIDNAIQALPDDARLDDLRQSADDFVSAVQQSDAADQMGASEAALSEFAGPAAARKAADAADTLEKFIARCKGMGDEASAALKFQPALSDGLGDTVDQLLDAAGLPTRGGGPGGGAGGGYSARRNTLSNVGLYGSLPRMSNRASRSGGNQSSQAGAGGDNGGRPGPADPAGADPAGRLRAAGESGARVPPVYRKKVGEYFQRVADELGQ